MEQPGWTPGRGDRPLAGIEVKAPAPAGPGGADEVRGDLRHPAGCDEMRRLREIGLDRFAMFVADWQPGEVQQLTALLERLTASMAGVAEREAQAARTERGRRSRAGSRDRARRP
jgi:hypothetical protein